MNILIVPLINEKEHGPVVQGKKFELSLQITNMAESPSSEFDMKHVILKSSEGHDIVENFGGKSFYVEKINPGESKVIKIGDTGQIMYGLVDLQCKMIPKIPGTVLDFYQKNPFTKEVTKTLTSGSWVDFFYIKSSGEDKQEKSTTWIMRLTWVIAIFTAVQVVSIVTGLLEKYYSFS